MYGERGQNSRVVVRVAIDVVVAVALDRAGGGVHSSTIPRDHRMRDPKNALPAREKSATTVVAGRREQGRPRRVGRSAGERPSGAKGSSMHGERGQSARVVVRVSIDVVVAVGE